MDDFLMQDLVTIQGQTTTKSVAQSAPDYLDLKAYQDFSAWVDVVGVDLGGAASATLRLETAPLQDDAFFLATGGVQTSMPLVVGVTRLRNILNAPRPNALGNWQIPLARWLRWRLDFPFGSTTKWSVTFRIFIAAHSVCLHDTQTG